MIKAQVCRWPRKGWLHPVGEDPRRGSRSRQLHAEQSHGVPKPVRKALKSRSCWWPKPSTLPRSTTAVTHDRARGTQCLSLRPKAVSRSNKSPKTTPRHLKASNGPLRGLEGHETRTLAFKQVPSKQVNQATAIMSRLVKCFREQVTGLAEINPWWSRLLAKTTLMAKCLPSISSTSMTTRSSAKRRSRPCLIPPKKIRRKSGPASLACLT